ncbi:hypothetical protein EJB05_32375 [Eragrostis curvula]|uniref:Uncharacterized protein n=1 Tax=Eragrostis curvula TaxID=38414 RepID=A0A5J9UHN1_9POAL|nr:hypothetical protein EJB05_32375 [Eragrostis curvula]
MELAKKACAWLFGQSTLDGDVAAPGRYELETEARTSEKYLVVLRAAYTVGCPKIGDEEGHPLLLHQPLLDVHAKMPDPCRVEKLVRRHVCALAAGMTASQMLTKGSRSFVKEGGHGPRAAGHRQARAPRLHRRRREARSSRADLRAAGGGGEEAGGGGRGHGGGRPLIGAAGGQRKGVGGRAARAGGARQGGHQPHQRRRRERRQESIQALTVRIDGSGTRAATRKVLLVAGAHKVAPLEVQETGMAAPAQGKGELPTDGDAHAN